MSWFKRDERISVDAIVTIVGATVEAMKAGGELCIDALYPLRHEDQEAAEEIEDAISHDREFIQDGGSVPAWEEEEETAETEAATD